MLQLFDMGLVYVLPEPVVEETAPEPILGRRVGLTLLTELAKRATCCFQHGA